MPLRAELASRIGKIYICPGFAQVNENRVVSVDSGGKRGAVTGAHETIATPGALINCYTRGLHGNRYFLHCAVEQYVWIFNERCLIGQQAQRGPGAMLGTKQRAFN